MLWAWNSLLWYKARLLLDIVSLSLKNFVPLILRDVVSYLLIVESEEIRAFFSLFLEALNSVEGFVDRGGNLDFVLFYLEGLVALRYIYWAVSVLSLLLVLNEGHWNVWVCVGENTICCRIPSHLYLVLQIERRNLSVLVQLLPSLVDLSLQHLLGQLWLKCAVLRVKLKQDAVGLLGYGLFDRRGVAQTSQRLRIGLFLSDGLLFL